MTSRWAKYLDDLRTLPGDAAIGWRNERWRGVWDALALRWVHRVFRRGRLVVYAQPVDTARDIAAPAGVTLTLLGEGDWSAVAALLTGRDLERFLRLHDGGHLCILAWRDALPIGYAWVALRMSPEVSQCPLPLPAHAAYLWDLYVVPTERRSGVGSALASARLRVARERGYTEGWRMIEESNHASLRTLAKSGGTTRVVGVMKFIKVLSRMRARFVRADDAGAAA